MLIPPYRGRHRRDSRDIIRLGIMALTTCMAVLALAEDVLGAVALAAAPTTLNQVIDNLLAVIRSLLVGLATLFLSVGGIRYIFAGGDPGEVEAAKKTLKYAGIGYGVAVLAEVLVGVLKQIVGAP